MTRIMNKDLLLNYIINVKNQNNYFFARKYFKTIIKIIDDIDMSSSLSSLVDLYDTEIFIQEYDLNSFGLYYIKFNISTFISYIENQYLQYNIINYKDMDNIYIYHEYPNNFSSTINYNSKIIITDFITKNTYYTIIDGNHTYQKNINLNTDFNFLYINVYHIPRECYLDDFSYFFHYLITELFCIFIQNSNNKKIQKELIKNTKLYRIYSELFL